MIDDARRDRRAPARSRARGASGSLLITAAIVAGSARLEQRLHVAAAAGDQDDDAFQIASLVSRDDRSAARSPLRADRCGRCARRVSPAALSSFDRVVGIAGARRRAPCRCRS